MQKANSVWVNSVSPPEFFLFAGRFLRCKKQDYSLFGGCLRFAQAHFAPLVSNPVEGTAFGKEFSTVFFLIFSGIVRFYRTAFSQTCGLPSLCSCRIPFTHSGLLVFRASLNAPSYPRPATQMEGSLFNPYSAFLEKKRGVRGERKNFFSREKKFVFSPCNAPHHTPAFLKQAHKKKEPLRFCNGSPGICRKQVPLRKPFPPENSSRS